MMVIKESDICELNCGQFHQKGCSKRDPLNDMSVQEYEDMKEQDRLDAMRGALTHISTNLDRIIHDNHSYKAKNAILVEALEKCAEYFEPQVDGDDCDGCSGSWRDNFVHERDCDFAFIREVLRKAKDVK